MPFFVTGSEKKAFEWNEFWLRKKFAVYSFYTNYNFRVQACSILWILLPSGITVGKPIFIQIYIYIYIYIKCETWFSGDSPDKWATTKQACRDELVVHLSFSSIYIYIYTFFINSLSLIAGQQKLDLSKGACRNCENKPILPPSKT